MTNYVKALAHDLLANGYSEDTSICIIEHYQGLKSYYKPKFMKQLQSALLLPQLHADINSYDPKRVIKMITDIVPTQARKVIKALYK